MTTIKRFGAVLAILALALGACAGPGAQREPRAKTGQLDPDQAAASALQRWAVDRDPSKAVALMVRAREQAPDRTDLIWLHIRLCNEGRGCEPEPIEARLRKLDPQNGAAWLGTLARAQARRDTAAEEQILEAMSRAAQFNVYWTTLIWRLTVARGGSQPAPTPASQPLTAALDETTEWLSRLTVPAFKPLTTACSQERTRDTARAARCERIATAMQSSDTTLVEGLGLGIAQRIAPPGSSAAAQLDRRVEVLGYRSQAAASVVRTQVERERFTVELIELMKQLRREQDVAVAILRWAGEPLEPR